jgi:acetoin utilization protein AcuB
MKVKDIMTTNLYTLHPKDKLSAAQELLTSQDFHHIIVNVNKKVVGIISQGDLLYTKELISKNADQFPVELKFGPQYVEDVMTSYPYTIEEDAILEDALSLMISKRINALPVTKSNDLVGMITSFDMLVLLKNQTEKILKIRNLVLNTQSPFLSEL